MPDADFPQRLSPDLLAAYQEISTATISTMLRSRYQILRHAMVGPVSLTPGLKAVGTAVTLRFLPKREDIVAGFEEEQTESRSALWASIMAIQEGDVLVVDAQANMQTGCLGEMLMTGVQARGGRGVVVDGCLRDTTEGKQLGLPLFCRGGTPCNAGFFEMYPWDYNTPIGCGGVLVMPGDLIVADDDGIVVVPPQLAPELAEFCRGKEAREIFERQRIRETGDVAKYHPMNAEARAEYERWLAQCAPEEKQ
jgi:regulator of RNase E activity RraA